MTKTLPLARRYRLTLREGFQSLSQAWKTHRQAQRQMAHLRSLPDDMLEDIGLTRSDVLQGRLPKH